MNTSEIKFSVTLDDENLPERITWEAPGSGMEGTRPAKSVMIALWDSPGEGALRIDLWTKKMMVNEMNRFFYETLRSMADTYHRATNEKAIADSMRDFALKFGRDANVLKQKS